MSKRADFLAATFKRLLAVRPPLSQDHMSKRADFLAATFKRLLAVRPPLSQDQIEAAMNEARNWSYQSPALKVAMSSPQAIVDMARVKAAWAEICREHQQAGTRRQEQLQGAMQNQSPWETVRLENQETQIRARDQARRQEQLQAGMQTETGLTRQLEYEREILHWRDVWRLRAQVAERNLEKAQAELRDAGRAMVAIEKKHAEAQRKAAAGAERGEDPTWTGWTSSTLWTVVDWTKLGFAAVGGFMVARWAWELMQ